MSYPKDCPAHGGDGCTKGECPDYMAVWLRGACSSGDPLRRALVLVLDEFDRRSADVRQPATEPHRANGDEQREVEHGALRRIAAMDCEDERYVPPDGWIRCQTCPPCIATAAVGGEDVAPMPEWEQELLLQGSLPATLASVDDVRRVCIAAGLPGKNEEMAEPRWVVPTALTVAWVPHPGGAHLYRPDGSHYATFFTNASGVELYVAIQAARSTS